MQSSTATSKGTRGRRVARGRRRLAAVLAGLALAATGAALAADDAVACEPQTRGQEHYPLDQRRLRLQPDAGHRLYQYGRTGHASVREVPRPGRDEHVLARGGYDPPQAWTNFNYVNRMATDSAAAATAMSTGVKTYDAAIGVDSTGTR